MAEIVGQYIPVPINIDTVNILLNQTIINKDQIKRWLKENKSAMITLKTVKKLHYSELKKNCMNRYLKNYTFKPWANYPKELDASVLLRIPVSEF